VSLALVGLAVEGGEGEAGLADQPGVYAVGVVAEAA
jgi:hypothetical protein